MSELIVLFYLSYNAALYPFQISSLFITFPSEMCFSSRSHYIQERSKILVKECLLGTTRIIRMIMIMRLISAVYICNKISSPHHRQIEFLFIVFIYYSQIPFIIIKVFRVTTHKSTSTTRQATCTTRKAASTTRKATSTTRTATSTTRKARAP